MGKNATQTTQTTQTATKKAKVAVAKKKAEVKKTKLNEIDFSLNGKSIKGNIKKDGQVDIANSKIKLFEGVELNLEGAIVKGESIPNENDFIQMVDFKKSKILLSPVNSSYRSNLELKSVLMSGKKGKSAKISAISTSNISLEGPENKHIQTKGFVLGNKDITFKEARIIDLDGTESLAKIQINEKGININQGRKAFEKEETTETETESATQEESEARDLISTGKDAYDNIKSISAYAFEDKQKEMIEAYGLSKKTILKFINGKDPKKGIDVDDIESETDSSNNVFDLDPASIPLVEVPIVPGLNFEISLKPGLSFGYGYALNAKPEIIKDANGVKGLSIEMEPTIQLNGTASLKLAMGIEAGIGYLIGLKGDLYAKGELSGDPLLKGAVKTKMTVLKEGKSLKLKRDNQGSKLAFGLSGGLALKGSIGGEITAESKIFGFEKELTSLTFGEWSLASIEWALNAESDLNKGGLTKLSAYNLTGSSIRGSLGNKFKEYHREKYGLKVMVNEKASLAEKMGSVEESRKKLDILAEKFEEVSRAKMIAYKTGSTEFKNTSVELKKIEDEMVQGLLVSTILVKQATDELKEVKESDKYNHNIDVFDKKIKKHEKRLEIIKDFTLKKAANGNYDNLKVQMEKAKKSSAVKNTKEEIAKENIENEIFTKENILDYERTAKINTEKDNGKHEDRFNKLSIFTNENITKSEDEFKKYLKDKSPDKDKNNPEISKEYRNFMNYYSGNEKNGGMGAEFLAKNKVYAANAEDLLEYEDEMSANSRAEFDEFYTEELKRGNTKINENFYSEAFEKAYRKKYKSTKIDENIYKLLDDSEKDMSIIWDFIDDEMKKTTAKKHIERIEKLENSNGNEKQARKDYKSADIYKNQEKFMDFQNVLDYQEDLYNKQYEKKYKDVLKVLTDDQIKELLTAKDILDYEGASKKKDNEKHAKRIENLNFLNQEVTEQNSEELEKQVGDIKKDQYFTKGAKQIIKKYRKGDLKFDKDILKEHMSEYQIFEEIKNYADENKDDNSKVLMKYIELGKDIKDVFKKQKVKEVKKDKTGSNSEISIKQMTDYEYFRFYEKAENTFFKNYYDIKKNPSITYQDVFDEYSLDENPKYIEFLKKKYEEDKKLTPKKIRVFEEKYGKATTQIKDRKEFIESIMDDKDIGQHEKTEMYLKILNEGSKKFKSKDSLNDFMENKFTPQAIIRYEESRIKENTKHTDRIKKIEEAKTDEEAKKLYLEMGAGNGLRSKKKDFIKEKLKNFKKSDITVDDVKIHEERRNQSYIDLKAECQKEVIELENELKTIRATMNKNVKIIAEIENYINNPAAVMGQGANSFNSVNDTVKKIKDETEKAEKLEKSIKAKITKATKTAISANKKIKW